MSKRLAITISGAVSLGSYEAGVLYEIITAIGQHNDTATADEDKIVIDVLTGASAGGMTAAIATQKLLFEADAFRGVYDNPFYNPWVRDVSLDGLLSLSAGEDPQLSILSSDLVESISRTYLTDRYRAGTQLLRKKHSAAAEHIKLMLALSNLNGVDYPVRQENGESFIYSRFQDEYIRAFSAGEPKDDAYDPWDSVRNAAVSCGAFPFAFRVKQVQRKVEEYPPDCDFAPTQMAFAYTDGGVFQNEPLGYAKHLVNEIDQHLNTETRYYLYVAPGAKQSVLNRKDPIRAGNARLWPTALAVVNAIFHQARFQEWVQAEEINASVKLFNQRAIGLQRALLAGRIEATALQPAAAGLLPLLFIGAPDLQNADRERQRLRQQFQPEYDALVAAKGEVIAKTWIDSILVLETAAEMSKQDEMKIYTVTATDEELAGDLLCSFGGFFDLRFRKNDYERGRANARKFLADHAANNGPHDIGPIRYPNPGPAPVPDPNIGKITMDQLDRGARVRFREQVMDRAGKMLEDMDVNWLVRSALLRWFIRPKVDDALCL